MLSVNCKSCGSFTSEEVLINTNVKMYIMFSCCNTLNQSSQYNLKCHVNCDL